MDGQRFDALARAVVARPSRRQLLRGLAGGAVAGMLTLLDAKRLRAHEDGASRVRVCFDGQTVEVPLPLIDARLFPGLTVGPCSPDGGCTADADCPDPDADPCTGTACVDGQCVAFIVTCAEGFVCCGNGACCAACGGIAGLPCPAGTECVDDPTDDCDPSAGGADCSGNCVPD